MRFEDKLIRITTIPLSLDKLLGGQMSFMKNYYKVIAVSSDETYLQKVGEKEGIEVFCVEMTRKITPLQDIKSLWKLYCFFKREKPLIVHTHTPKAGTLGMMAAWLAKVPNRLHTVAGLPLLESQGCKRKLLNFVEKITYKCSTHIYPNSSGLKEFIINENLASSNKLKVIANGSSNGIDTSFFNPLLYSSAQKDQLRQGLNINLDDFVFIFVGRLVSDKGINELVEAFDQVSLTYENAKLLLVGPMESDLDPLKEKTIELIKINKAIISTGFQYDVRPFFYISDALVFPSYREGFPNVVMQAGAMGLPAIVTDINGCNEIIEEDINGTIIVAKNAALLKEKMELFLTDGNLIKRLQGNARSMIKSRYEQQVVWNALLDEYNLLKGKSNV